MSHSLLLPGRAATALLLLGAVATAEDAYATPKAAAPPAATPAPNDHATTAPGPVPAVAGEEASTHFKRGLQLFDEGDYTLALVEFERAYQLAPNYRALYNIALVDMQLGRYADAARTLEQYIRDGGDAIPASRQQEVKKKLSELSLRTATVDLSTNTPAAEITLDDKLLDPSLLKAPMVIDAGEHTLRATAAGFASANRTLTLAGGDRIAVRLELVALQTQGPRAPTETERHAVFWPGFVATGVFAAGAIISGAIMLDDRSHLTTLQNQPDSSAATRESWANHVNTAALVADIFTGAAVIGGGISLYLSLRPLRSPKAPSVGLSPQHIVVSGCF